MRAVTKLSQQAMLQLRFRVFERDGYRCVALELDEAHRCSNAIGFTEPGQWDYLQSLTYEHVPKFSAKGKRADDREEQGLTLCIGANSWTGWSQTHRHVERLHLARLYPAHWADVPEVQP